MHAKRKEMYAMEIMALPKSMTEEEARKIAEGRGNLLGRFLLRKKEITLKLMYLESKEIIYSLSYDRLPFLPRISSPASPKKQQKICMLVEGTRCMPAFLDKPLQTVPVRLEDESQLQNTEFSDQKLIEEGKALARRMVRRQSGRHVSMEPESIRSIYRPCYIAFYGELVHGQKVRYLPIPADGNEIRRAF